MHETIARRAHVERAHLDTFARDHLPPRDLWPAMHHEATTEIAAYPDRFNAAAALLDGTVAGGRGAAPVFHFHGGRWSYDQLLDRANRIASVLVDDLGLIPGNRVLLRGPNNPMMAACWFAVLKAGGVVVATMPLLRERELRFVVEKAQVRFAISDAHLSAELDGLADGGSCLERTLRYATTCDDADLSDGELERAMSTRSGAFENVETAADDVALIAFTSGTTGEAKGTMHTHRDTLAICDLFPRSILRASADDIFCGSPPFAFTYGLGGILLFPIRMGASTLLLEQASPPHLIAGIERFRATVCFTAPTAYRAMLGLLDSHDVSSLRRCVSAGEALPLATFEAWRAATGVSIIDGIGSTEMLHIFISAAEDEIRPGSTGKPVPGYRARIVDQQGDELPVGAVGRLAVQGPTGCRYLDDEERQRAYVQNGWNVTGDAYRMDEDGYFWYQARSDDMIVSAGYNIAGPEVEAVLLEHPAVLECGVVGLPDPERGQVVAAFIVLRDGAEAGSDLVETLQAHVKQQIAPYKYPRRITFVEALPRTQTGKLQRFRLRELES